MELQELFFDNDNLKLVLPDFQRDLEWKVDKQKQLLASFFVSLPIGSFLTLKGTKNDFAAKKLCFPNEVIEPKEECVYLLDGQQRLSSLKSIFSDFFGDKDKWVDTWEKIYKDLRNRWFIKIKPNIGEDIFGWNNLQFNGIQKLEPKQLLGFFEMKPINKNKVQEWFNPGYFPKDDSGVELTPNRRKNDIAKHAASEYLVPLYTIYDSIISPEKSLHTFVLEQIASNRINELKAEVADQKKDISVVLGSIEPEISELDPNNEEDQEKIRNAWARLGAKWSESVANFLSSLLKQKLIIHELPSDEISRAIAIFESINEGGTKLSTFDLVVAKAARDKTVPALSKRISDLLETQIELTDELLDGIIGEKPNKWYSANIGAIDDNKISNIVKEQYLNLLSIFSFTEYGKFDSLKVDLIKRAKILQLNHDSINSKTEETIKSLIRACAFLQMRCGIVNLNDVPYKLMMLPIAYCLNSDDVWCDKSKLAKIEYWYWSSLFGGAYREAQNEKCIKDIIDLYNWLFGMENKFKARCDSVLNDRGYSDIDVLLLNDDEHDVPSAVYNGIHQFILSKQPKDFLPDSNHRLNTWDIAQKKMFTYKDNRYHLKINDHHIFPLDAVAKMDESTKTLRKNKKHKLNSPLNRTYISETANNIILDKTPPEYLQYVSQTAPWDHCLPTNINQVYTRLNGEDDNTYFERILKARFDELYKELKRELETLV